MSKSRDFGTFIGILVEAYECYRLNLLMHKKITGKRYRKYIKYWALTLRSTQFHYLVRLACLFSRSDEKSVTVYHFLDYKFDKYEKLLDDLKTLRNKYLVHLDIDQTREFKSFLDRLDISREKFQSLFELLIKEAKRLAEQYQFVGDLNNLFVKEPQKTKKEFSDLYALLS